MGEKMWLPVRNGKVVSDRVDSIQTTSTSAGTYCFGEVGTFRRGYEFISLRIVNTQIFIQGMALHSVTNKLEK